MENVVVERELNPGSLLEWLSVVDDGKKTVTKRSDLSCRVKKHLSALGWTFSYLLKDKKQDKGKKREMRYKSPNGRWYYSLATACRACVGQQPQQQHHPPQQHHSQPQQQQHDPTFDLACSPRNRDESNQKQTKENVYSFEDCYIAGLLTPDEENHSSDSNHRLQRKRLKSCDTKGSTSSDEENLSAILPCVGVSNQQATKNNEQVEDCDMAAFIKEILNEEKSRSSDSIELVLNVDTPTQQQKKSCDAKCSNSDEENPSTILSCVGVSNQQPKKKNSERVKDCDAAAFDREAPNEQKSRRSSDSTEIVLNVDTPNQQQKKRRPGNGKPLMNILKAMKKKENMEKESLRFWRKDCGPDMNCKVCSVCHWGEDLLQCDGCPSAFHLTCLGLSSLSEEELWFCPCCCCDICGSMESPGNSMLMHCGQCQRRFHLKCLEEEPYVVSRTDWFCSSQCNKVFGKLQSLLGCKIAVGDGNLVWRLMRAPNEEEQYDEEQNSKLDSAVQILHEGFDLTDDPLCGRDLVEEMIFTRDGAGAARGYYMVLIEKNNEPIVVAALRVDKDVAEIPLMATLPNYRTIEMSKVLMDELEKQVSHMGVYKLVLPAPEEVLATWKEQFGFSVMESSERLEFVKHGMFDFVGTLMCHKFLR